ncbi:MAG TPA: oligosaccharide flippase family protein [Allosphingosinicella sp.]
MLRQLGRDVAIYGGADLLFKLVQFLVIPIYAHRLAVADFGILALLQVSAILLGAIVNLGVNYSVQRFYFDKEIDESRRPLLVSTGLFQLLVSGTILIGIVGFLLYGWREPIHLDYGIAWPLVLVALATILPDQIAQYALDTSRLQFAPLKFCAIAMVKNVAGLMLGLWLLLSLDMGVLGLLVGNLVAAIAAVPLGLWLVRRDLTLGVDREYLSTMLRFGTPFVFTAAAYWAFGSLDRWMLAEMSDAVQVGLFSIAFKFASVLTLAIGAFHQAWIPLAMRMANEEPDYRRLFSMVFSGWFCFLGLTALGLALFADDVMAALTPKSYWPAAQALAIGAAAIALSGTMQITSLGVTLEKRTLLIATGAWMTAGINVGLNLLLIPRLGASGSAIATLLSYLFLTLFYLGWSQRLHPIPLERGRLAYGLLLVVAATAAAFLPKGEALALVPILGKLSILAVALLGGVLVGAFPFALLRRVFLRTGTQSL